MKHTISHGLSHELARLATRHALEDYRRDFSEYDTRGEWTTDDRAEVSFKVMGKTLRGTVDVGPEIIVLALEVPLLFRAFRTIALKVVEDEISKWIERARRGELDDEMGQ